MDTGERHYLGHDAIHTSWDNTLPPQLTLAPGDTCIFETREPSQGKAARGAMAHLAADLDPDLATIVAAAARHDPATGGERSCPYRAGLHRRRRAR
jgi:acetamidase/formamidase